jgi:hypothetical protein
MATSTLVMLLLRPTALIAVYSISECQIGFIDLNLPMEQLSVRANHCTTQSVQHSPRCLIAAKAKNALQPQCTDTMPLAGDVPNGSKPDAQLSARFIKMVPAVTVARCLHAGQINLPRLHR